jgi:hypothetical protein
MGAIWVMKHWKTFEVDVNFLLREVLPPIHQLINCRSNMADEFPLHECVFRGDIRQLSQLLRSHDVAQKDKHGEDYILSVFAEFNLDHTYRIAVFT